MNAKAIILVAILCMVNISLADDAVAIRDPIPPPEKEATIHEEQESEIMKDNCIAAYNYESMGRDSKAENPSKAAELLDKAAELFEIVAKQQTPNSDCPRGLAYSRAADAHVELGNINKAIELYSLSAKEYEANAQKSNSRYDYKDAIDAYKNAGNNEKADELQTKLNALEKEL